MGKFGHGNLNRSKVVKKRTHYWRHGNHKSRGEIARMVNERYKKRHDFEPVDTAKENWSTRKEATQ